MSVGISAGVGAIIASGIGAAGAVTSGVIGSKAAKDSAATIAQGQQKAAQNITDVVAPAVQSGKDTIDQANLDLSNAGDSIAANYDPFTQGASEDVQQLRDLTGPNGALAEKFSFNQQDFENTPAYKIMLDRGKQAIERSAAAQGGLLNTNTLKRLNEYATDTTNTQFGDAADRALRAFRRIARPSGSVRIPSRVWRLWR